MTGDDSDPLVNLVFRGQETTGLQDDHGSTPKDAKLTSTQFVRHVHPKVKRVKLLSPRFRSRESGIVSSADTSSCDTYSGPGSGHLWTFVEGRRYWSESGNAGREGTHAL